MPRYETPQNKEVERRAKRIMEKHLGVSLIETPDAHPIDFYNDEYACEHKGRVHVDNNTFWRRGSVYFEVQKYWAVMHEHWFKGKTPLLVVTLRGGRVGYCDARTVDITRTEVARRNVPRGSGDDDECFHALCKHFKFIDGSGSEGCDV